ncbi:hypothetical protein XH79_16440 [Bradyrhizobium sp. CCBAU 45389]|nr:hypothetical protein [Bradyrhizobium sp. CCBAU 45389]
MLVQQGGRETCAPHAQGLLGYKFGQVTSLVRLQVLLVKCRNLMGFLVAFKAAGGSAHAVGSFYHRPAERRTPYH